MENSIILHEFQFIRNYATAEVLCANYLHKSEYRLANNLTTMDKLKCLNFGAKFFIVWIDIQKSVALFGAVKF